MIKYNNFFDYITEMANEKQGKPIEGLQVTDPITAKAGMKLSDIIDNIHIYKVDSDIKNDKTRIYAKNAKFIVKSISDDKTTATAYDGKTFNISNQKGTVHELSGEEKETEFLSIGYRVFGFSGSHDVKWEKYIRPNFKAGKPLEKIVEKENENKKIKNELKANAKTTHTIYFEDGYTPYYVNINGREKCLNVYLKQTTEKKSKKLEKNEDGSPKRDENNKLIYGNPESTGEPNDVLVLVTDGSDDKCVSAQIKRDKDGKILIPWSESFKPNSELFNEIINVASEKIKKVSNDNSPYIKKLYNIFDSAGLISSSSDNYRDAVLGALQNIGILANYKSIVYVCTLFGIQNANPDTIEYYKGKLARAINNDSNKNENLTSHASDTVAETNAAQTVAMARVSGSKEKYFIKLFSGTSYSQESRSIYRFDADRQGNLKGSENSDRVSSIGGSSEVNISSFQNKKASLSDTHTEESANNEQIASQLEKILGDSKNPKLYDSLDAAKDAVTDIFKIVHSDDDEGYYAKIISMSKGSGESGIINGKNAEKFIQRTLKSFDDSGNPEYNSLADEERKYNKIRDYIPRMVNFMFGQITESYMQKILTLKNNKKEFNKVFAKYVEQIKKFKDQIGDVSGNEITQEYTQYYTNAHMDKAILSPQTYYVICEFTDDFEFLNSMSGYNFLVKNGELTKEGKTKWEKLTARFEDAISKAVDNLKAAIKDSGNNEQNNS